MDKDAGFLPENFVDYRLVPRAETLEEVRAVGFMSDFHPMFTQISADKSEFILVIVDRQQVYGDSWRVCLTAEAQTREMAQIEAQEAEKKALDDAIAAEKARRAFEETVAEKEERAVALAAELEKAEAAAKKAEAAREEKEKRLAARWAAGNFDRSPPALAGQSSAAAFARTRAAMTAAATSGAQGTLPGGPAAVAPRPGGRKRRSPSTTASRRGRSCGEAPTAAACAWPSRCTAGRGP